MRRVGLVCVRTLRLLSDRLVILVLVLIRLLLL